MNYRHIFHAGNFADVVKHVVLCRILAHLKQKAAPFRVIDTHAGAGRYDLSAPRAERTGEWRGGVGRLDEGPLAAKAEALIAPYREVLGEIRNEHGPLAYPGSPDIARRLARPGDRVVAIESEEQAFAGLRACFGRNARAKAVRLDGWTGLLAYVPPKERRGLVLIDPPYEDPHEFQTVAERLAEAWRKWPTGIYCVWYPVMDARLVERFLGRIEALGIERVLRAEIEVHKAAPGRGLGACGLLIVNPPWKLDEELRVLLPALAARMAKDEPRWKVEWVAPEASVRAREPAA
jgi:23S rRNA (adenine2030-N6)-methyltransferase